MTQPGRELKARRIALMRKHDVKPIERAPIPLFEGIAASADVDVDRMSFKSGSLSWLSDLGKIPLLIRHDPKRVAGRILDLDYRPDGRLLLRRPGRRSGSRAHGWIVDLCDRA
jgi:hypothetical protein